MTRRILILMLLQVILSYAEAQELESAKPLLAEKIFVHTDKSFYVAGEMIWLKIYNVDAATSRPSNISKVAYVEIISSEGQVAVQAKIELRSGKGAGNIPLPLSVVSGNWILRCYTRWMRNEGSAHFFEKPITIINATKKLAPSIAKAPDNFSASTPQSIADKRVINTVTVKTNKSTFNKREKVEMNMVAIKGGDLPGASLSVSVFLTDELQPASHGTISDFLKLENQRPGLTANKVVNGFRYLPEFAGHLVETRVVNNSTGQPVENVPAYFSIPGQRFQYRVSKSDAEGKAVFVSQNYYGGGEIVLQTNRSIDSNYRVEIINPFSTEKPSMVSPQFAFDKRYEAPLLMRSVAVQVDNAFPLYGKEQYLIPEFQDSTAFFGKPDISYNLDEYTRFMTMDEVMREFVDDVRVRKQGNQYRFEVRNHPYKLFFDRNPLILLDGVPIFNVNRVMELDPLKVQRLDVVTQRVYQGGFVYDGIVSYTTYAGDLGGYALDDNAVILSYPGFLLQKEFYSPQYEATPASPSRIPDFRNLLYWNPDISLSASGSNSLLFYTSDIPGTYTVVVQGVDANGYALFGTHSFTVN